MLTKEVVKELVTRKTETRSLEYKGGIDWDKSEKKNRIDILKDILAMSNTKDGGVILIGFQDSDFSLVGLSNAEFNSWDSTKVNDLLKEYSDPGFACQVYKFSDFDGGRQIVAIEVPEFTEDVIICKKDWHDEHKQVLKRGCIYIRTDKPSSESVTTNQDMRELLGRALSKKGDSLLSDIERLLKGKPISYGNEEAEKYSAELADGEKYFASSIGEYLQRYGYWEVSVSPVNYHPKRVADLSLMREYIRKAEVELRGWDFPHTDSKDGSNFLNGYQSVTIWKDKFYEAYRAYGSGLFLWKSAYWEDVRGYKTDEGDNCLSFVNVIWTITEIVLFVRRYYEHLSYDGSLHIQITLNKTKGRSLKQIDSWGFSLPHNKTTEDSIPLSCDVSFAELKANFKEFARNMARDVLRVFNLADISEQTVEDWQTKLLERKF
ncbi:MAG: ATP-binding protein [Elusimicrobiales bacterium]|nr:ATP-binding protein [Elusimicrobiales bacterium]